jgi:hypothetical protein
MVSQKHMVVHAFMMPLLGTQIYKLAKSSRYLYCRYCTNRSTPLTARLSVNRDSFSCRLDKTLCDHTRYRYKHRRAMERPFN